MQTHFALVGHSAMKTTSTIDGMREEIKIRTKPRSAEIEVDEQEQKELNVVAKLLRQYRESYVYNDSKGELYNLKQ